MKKKRFLILLLILALMILVLPRGLTAHAGSIPGSFIFDISDGNITVAAGTGGTLKVSYGVAQNLDSIPLAQEISIIQSGSTTTNKIVVNNVTAKIKLNAVDIQQTTGDICAFNLISNANVTLVLTGNNTLKSSGGNPGLRVIVGQTISIKDSGSETGSLTATGASYAAGIGGGNGAGGGTINIVSGTVNATGGSDGAGIGGGSGGGCGTINTFGGTVNATGGINGAGLGGGNSGGGGTISISNGIVYAIGGLSGGGGGGGSAIGGGYNGSSGTIQILGGDVTAIGRGWYVINGSVTINAAATVKAVSKYNFPTALQGSLAGDAKLLMVVFETQQTTNSADIYVKGNPSPATSFLPRYQSVAFTVTTGTYQVKVNSKLQQHDGDSDFIIPDSTGLTTFYNVGDPILNSIAITKPATKTVYRPGEALDIAGMIVTETYSDDSTIEETITDANVTGFDSSVETASQLLTITVGGKETTYIISVAKADGPEAPEAPIIESKTDTSVILTKNGLQEFSMDYGTNWQDSEVFTGLSPSTSYTFVARIKETEITNESAVSDGTDTITLTVLAQILAEAKVTAKGVITSVLGSYTESDYTLANWTILTGFKTDGDTGIDAATNLVGVTSAQETATNGMAEVFTIEQTIAQTLAASLAMVKSLVEGTAFTMSHAATIDEEVVRAAIEEKISTLALDGVTATVTKIHYTPAVAGNAGTPAGINGTYTFAVGLSKGVASGTTASISMTIVATVFHVTTPDTSNSGGSGAGGNNESSNNSGTSDNNGSNTDSESDDSSVTPSNKDVDILVNDTIINAGTKADTVVNGTAITTVSLDEKKVEEKIATEGKGAVISIPINNSTADVLIGELNGRMVKNMESQQAIIEVTTDTATYTLPALQINIDAISKQLGKNIELEDIVVTIEIAKTSTNKVEIVENAADKGNFTIIAPPVEFNIKCTYGNETINVSKFNTYVERIVAIPAGMAKTKITTGVVIDADGTVRHVPTKIIIIDGIYYAKINSLTNSTYAVIWNPITYKDVVTHPSKKAINDLGSRMVISGAKNGLFRPDSTITRAEFVAMLVTSLGLTPGIRDTLYTDVKLKDWYCKYIEVANEYGIISGSKKAKFRPNDKITTEEAMTMLTNAMKITRLKVTFKKGEAKKLVIALAKSGQSQLWADNSMAVCMKAGIVSVNNKQKIAPKDKITRAETAVMIKNLLMKSKLI